jgi:hypothetical protein
MHEIRFGQRLRRLVQKRPASQILFFATPLTHNHSTGYVMAAANYQAATTGAGQSLSQTERFNSERTDCGPSVNPSAGSFLQDPIPLLTNYDSMKMSNNIDQFWYVEKLTTLTQLYLELRLPLHHALRATEADLLQPEDLGSDCSMQSRFCELASSISLEGQQ